MSKIKDKVIEGLNDSNELNTKSQFIQDVETFAAQMAERLPKTNEGGIIIMATDDVYIANCIIARPSHRKKMVEHMFADNDIQNDVLKILEEHESE